MEDRGRPVDDRQGNHFVTIRKFIGSCLSASAWLWVGLSAGETWRPAYTPGRSDAAVVEGSEAERSGRASEGREIREGSESAPKVQGLEAPASIPALRPRLETCLRLDRASVRDMPSVESFISITLVFSMGFVKLGQPVPESNLSVEAKSGSPVMMST